MSRPFFDAIKQGNWEEVERQLDADPGLIHVRENGLSPIMVAAYYHHREIASYLADKTVALTIFEASATGRSTISCGFWRATHNWSMLMRKMASRPWDWPVTSVTMT
jgi:hypothetical protein